MRSAAALLVLLVLVPAGLAGTDPRAEKERLTPADMSLARKAALQRGDLPAGWTPLVTRASDGKVPSCPDYRPDFSRFTITGKSQTAFQHAAGASIFSSIEVFRSRAQAVGDFRLGTTPQVARCLKVLLNKALAQARGFTAEIVSSRQVAAPRIGERSAAFRLVAEIGAGGPALTLYIDVLVFQRGRSIAVLSFTGASQPVKGQAPLARAVASRLR